MAATIKFIDGGSVTSPQGFSAGATYAGLKTFAEDKLDLGIIASDSPCTAAGVFTTSTIKSPTVSVNQAHLKLANPKGIIVNAGIANACVGEQGYKDAEEMASIAASKLNTEPSEILVCSTGVIGVELPMSLIRDGADNINLSKAGANQVARAMMTTDTRPKEIAVSCEIDGKTVSIGGVAKGSGMIHPNMATMLSFITTDANVEQHFLEHCLTEVADSSYNMLTVDGDTSTNDTVLVLANGSAGNDQIKQGSQDADTFEAALLEVAIFLTKELARDGEGASRLLSIEVTGAKDIKSARQAARTICSSSLVKSAVYGSDPNWGRVLAALGRSEIEADETKIDLFVNGVCIMESGTPIPFHKEAVVVLMKGPEVTFKLQLNLGDASATAWGCDLTQEYVIINSAYTT
ncbi:MAG: bifunctional ornithine acetyltransferase/N-acetylglutamate synthase [Dehalococcoidia bacterium]|nr:bifunctional ornithine acetyltransferase/N-acetylglutamate synthase [Dehalococcoidia bacterium]|tara:strand:- start:7944 stop:9161 length:1218 start_codon:yes stop_codon:yes gene_type:complete